MNWFKQNRALATLLIAFGICVLFAGLVLYWRWATWSNAKQTFDQAAAEKSRLDRLDPFPNDANYRKLQGYLDRYNTALDAFKDELKKEVVPAPPLAPNEFQSRLRLATVATLNRAQTNNVKLPLNILLDAKVDSVTSFRRAPLSEEHAASSTPTPSPAAGRTGTATKTATPSPALLKRNIVDLTFKATPAAARKVLNEIVNSSGQFFIIRTLYVHNEKDKGPPRQRTGEPAPAASPTEPGTGAPLNFIVGNEHIEVSATIEMLRFGSNQGWSLFNSTTDYTDSTDRCFTKN